MYFGSFDGYFYSLDIGIGTVIWKFNTIGDTYFPKGEIQKPAFVHDGIVYFGSGDYNIYALDIETGTGNWNMKEDVIKDYLASGAKVFALGGNHSTTFPIIKAHHDKYPVMDILHIDAHADLYDEYEGDKYSHACPFAQIMESGFAARLVQVGIRTLNTHQAEQAKKYNVEVHQMKDLDISSIPKFENPLYISLDMDAFDPAFAPGVSYHEPGGLSSRQVIDLIQSIDSEVIGADIVEYNPNRDFQDMTAFLAAKMMKEFLGKMIEK